MRSGGGLAAVGRADDVEAGRRVAGLTGRERQILALIARGYGNQAICDELVLTGKTVETHVRSVYAKLGLSPHDDVHRRVAAVLIFLAAERAETRRGPVVPLPRPRARRPAHAA